MSYCNGIEYGMMQAYAEGFELIRRKHEIQPDLRQIAEIWRYGSVVRSWLLDLISDALGKNPTLEGIAPYVADSGEGRWTAKEAIDLGCAISVITASLEPPLLSQDTGALRRSHARHHAQRIGGACQVKTEAGKD